MSARGFANPVTKVTHMKSFTELQDSAKQASAEWFNAMDIAHELFIVLDKLYEKSHAAEAAYRAIQLELDKCGQSDQSDAA